MQTNKGVTGSFGVMVDFPGGDNRKRETGEEVIGNSAASLLHRGIGRAAPLFLRLKAL